MREKKLMIVAHPDDEIVFGGAHLLKEKHWKVVCITNGSNRRRASEFRNVMKLIEVEYEIWNYKDTYSTHFDVASLQIDLHTLIQQDQFAKIVTHGLGGEYGHPQHKVIARLMRTVVNHNLYAFSIGKKKLPESILSKKKQLLDLYPSQRRTIWELCRDDYLNCFIEREHFALVRK